MTAATATAVPNVLAIGSVDPTGARGVLADIKVCSALGAYGCAVVAAVAAVGAHGKQGMSDLHVLPAAALRAQLNGLLASVTMDAVKTGLLPSAAGIAEVAQALAAHRAPHLVLDPVLVDRRGDALLDKAALGVLREALLPLATVITPNLPEAGLLLQRRAPDSLREMQKAAEALREAMTHVGSRWVYLKGGRLTSSDSPDLLFDGDRMIELPAPRMNVRVLGAGDAIAAALAALLPQAADVPTAARRAREYVGGAIAQATRLRVSEGQGQGAGEQPVHHLHDLRRQPR
jgi:hydroxymethylpyrimidine/phosphomethylpyrimidine kinase